MVLIVIIERKEKTNKKIQNVRFVAYILVTRMRMRMRMMMMTNASRATP